MRNQFYLLAFLLCTIDACTSASDKQVIATTKPDTISTEKVYYKTLDLNKCMSVLFADFKTDSAYTDYVYRDPINPEAQSEIERATTGEIDTSWFWMPKNNEDIARRYQGRLTASEIEDSLAVKRVQYQAYYYCKLDSVIAVVYNVKNLKRTRIKNEDKFGLAIFRKNSSGWFVSNNDFNFQDKIRSGQEIKAVQNAGVVDGKPAFLFVCESTDTKIPLTRQILIVDYNSHSFMPPANALFEVDNFNTNSLFSISSSLDLANSTASLIKENLLGTTASITTPADIKYVFNAQGQITNFKYFKLYDATNSSHPAKLLLEGRVIESFVPIKYGTSSDYVYTPQYRMVNLWKNYIAKTAAFYTGTQFHTYAEGSLKDTAIVLAQGTRRLDEQRAIAREADDFNQNVDQHFRKMQKEQEMTQAVDKVIRDLGLCSYCSGKGCLQCGGTGKRQRGY